MAPISAAAGGEPTTVALIPHPSTAALPLAGIVVRLRREGSMLHLTYRLEGDVSRLRLPPAAAEPAFVVGLWEHTCAETFVAAAGAAAYHELNFSPSGDWAAFAFSAYRQLGALDGDVAAPRITADVGPGHLEIGVALGLDSLAPAYATAPLRLGLSAVVEADDGRLAYWSLFHPPGKADFHHADARRLPLPATEARS